jgi:hypothetical protein
MKFTSRTQSIKKFIILRRITATIGDRNFVQIIVKDIFKLIWFFVIYFRINNNYKLKNKSVFSIYTHA